MAGYIGPRNEALLKGLSEDMRHRGPDGDGFYSSGNIHLVNRRLAIIDRAGGDQPIFNEDKTIAVVYNGEIYNYRELRTELESAGHRFCTVSDTEVIVHGYEEWGSKVFDRLNGMFGIALFDGRTKTLVLARDHFGIKPLYYAIPDDASHRLVFASEIKTILGTKLLHAAPNDRTIYRYLMYRVHDDTDETFFAGIHRLLPGQMMTVTPEGQRELSFFTHLQDELVALPEKTGETEEEVERAFGKLFTDAVRTRLISEVPVGMCLSGGLDSSSVVAVSHELLTGKVREAESLGSRQNAFSAIFPGSSNNEEHYIQDLSAQYPAVAVHYTRPTHTEFIADLQDFVRTQEEPTISTGPYAQYQVTRLAKGKVTVLLDGQGSDEMMAGYLPYYQVYLKHLVRVGRWGRFASELWAARDIIIPQAMRKLGLVQGGATASVRRMVSPDFYRAHAGERFTATPDNMKKRLVEDIFKNSLQSLLRYEDKNAMRFSLEGRVPFLDLPLIRFVMSHTEWIIRGGWNKWLLRSAMRGKLPETIRGRRNKIGFTTPEGEWFLKMKEEILAIITSKSFGARPYVNQGAVIQEYARFLSGETSDSMVFWRFVNLELWMREFIDPAKKQPEVRVDATKEGPLLKKKAIAVGDGAQVVRYAVRTKSVTRTDDLMAVVGQAVTEYVQTKKNSSDGSAKRWMVAVSEKIVAITQGRSYFLWEIRPSWLARMLSRFVLRTPYGIGLGSPWTMELAIREAGALRIVAAAAVAIATKPFGMRGMFYRVAGNAVSAIDGPTEYSLFPSNVSAKLPPSKPGEVAQNLRQSIAQMLDAKTAGLFDGVAIVDANDIGQKVMGNASAKPDRYVVGSLADNPAGQSDECTPVIILEEV